MNKLKVGDKVRVVKEIYESPLDEVMLVEKGALGVVISLDDDALKHYDTLYPYQVKLSDGDICWFNYDEIELGEGNI